MPASGGTSIWAEHALINGVWEQRVRLTIEHGCITTIERAVAPALADEWHWLLLPGFPNLHSHAFQRGMAGLAEQRGESADSFWTWREIMYRFVDRMQPEHLEAIAAMAYVEMLESGFTRVGEFHYLHHDPKGQPYADPAEMAHALTAAAHSSGIALTLLPVFYAYSGFGEQPPNHGQRRFIHSPDSFAGLIEASHSAVSALPDARVGIAPHSLRAVSKASLEEILPLAIDGPVHIHVAEQVREVDDCVAAYGARPVEWLLANADVDDHWCLVHATHMTEGETRDLAASRAVAGLCPITEANLGDGLFPARAFRDAGGRIGIGSDSNIRIDLWEEMRLLEYGQRLIERSRNVMADGAGRSTGADLVRAVIAGGGGALGVNMDIVEGGSADFVSLDPRHPSLACRDDDLLLDSMIFAADRSAIDGVWRRGVRLVTAGKHHARADILARYRHSLETLVH